MGLMLSSITGSNSGSDSGSTDTLPSLNEEPLQKAAQQKALKRPLESCPGTAFLNEEPLQKAAQQKALKRPLGSCPRTAFQLFKEDRLQVHGKDWAAIGREWSGLDSESRQRYFEMAESEMKDRELNGVATVYKIVQRSTGAVGGNAAGGAIYGEVTRGSMQGIINLMKEHCEFSSISRFLDIGSGLGKPNLHVAQDPKARLSVGVELIEERFRLSMVNLRDCLKVANDPTLTTGELHGNVMFSHLDIDQTQTLNPFTHVYSFDVGFPPELLESIGDKFKRSKYAEWLISYQPPYYIINDYGFPVEFLFKTMVDCHGSGEGHTVYFYKRNMPLARSTPKEKDCVVTLLKRPKRFDEKVLRVRCDPAFLPTIRTAVKPVAEVLKEVTELIDSHLDRKPAKRLRRSLHDDIYEYNK